MSWTPMVIGDGRAIDLGNKVMMEIIYDRCINCNLCLKACPAKVFQSDGQYVWMDQQNKKYCLNCNDCVSVCPRDAIYKDDVADAGVEGNVLGRDYSCNPEQFLNVVLNIRPIRNFVPQNLTQPEKEYLFRLAALPPRYGLGGETPDTGIILVENGELLAAIEQYTYHYLLALKKNMSSVWQVIPNLLNAGLRRNIKTTLSKINRLIEAYQKQINLLTFHAPNLLLFHSERKNRDAGENLTIMGYQLMLGANVLDLGSCFLHWVSLSLQPTLVKPSAELEAIYRKLSIPNNREIRSVLAVGKPQVSYRKLYPREENLKPVTIL